MNGHQKILISHVVFAFVSLSFLSTSALAQKTEIPFQIYQALDTKDGNVDVSPLSLKIAFSLIYPGAKGKTQKLYEKIFGFQSKVENPFRADYEFADAVAKAEGDQGEFVIANSAWLDQPDSLKKPFEKSLKEKNTEIGRLDVTAINQWVDQATHHHITQLFKRLPASTHSVFVNALYLKQNWQIPFDPGSTQKQLFYQSATTSQKVDMMHGKLHLGYYEDDESQWISMPYAKSPLSMYFILPKKRFGLKAIEQKLATAWLERVTAGLQFNEVTVSLPKFNFSRLENLNKPMSDAGYSSLFTGAADYSAITGEKFEISQVVQATSIEVNEAGTVASAATGITMRNSAMRHFPEPKVFTADQPFLFLLRNETTKEIYWLGRVSKPWAAH